MASADGRITIEIELEDGSVVRGLGDIGNEADRVGNRTTSAFGKVGGALKTAGAVAVGVVAGITALGVAAVGLSAPLVKAAADAQALNSQFSQVFGNLESTAQKTINTIGEATGINSDRLKGSFLQIAAFAKTTGVDTAGALDLSKRALETAADSAAFYDRSLEDTTESLQSFLKGNFENDAALGIAATETTRNAVANRLYGQSFKDLSESQKQVALLTLVEDGNKLSGALGQAARESDGLENVLGNLRQAYENFKISLGDAILETAIGLLKGLTATISSIDTTIFVAGITAVIDILTQLYDFVSPFLSNLFTSFSDTLSNIDLLWRQNSSDILDIATTVFGGVFTVISGILKQLSSIFDRIVSSISKFWNENFTLIYNSAKTIIENVLKTISNVLNTLLSVVGSALDDILDYWDKNGADILLIVTTIFNAVLAVINFVMPAVRFVIETVWTAIFNIISGALDLIIGVVKVFSGIFSGDFSKLWDGVKQIFSGAIDLIFGLISISFIGAIRTAITSFGKAVINGVKTNWTTIVNFFKNSTTSITTNISNFVNSILSFVRNLFTNFTSTISNLWSSVGTSFSNGVTAATRFVTGLRDTILNTFRGINLVEIGKNIIQGLINGIGSLASKVADTVKNIASSVTNGIKNVLNINSPSKVTTWLGEEVDNGLIVGMENQEGNVSKQAMKVADSTAQPITNTLRNASVSLGKTIPLQSKNNTSALNTNNIDNSKNPVYNINVQNDQTEEIARTMRRLQFGY